MTTIRDVAKRAEVSAITVSRVINDFAQVSDHTRQKVQKAIIELNYVPNDLGKQLRGAKTMTLALVLTDITNSFWTSVARGVEDVAQSNGYSTILCNTDESAEKEDHYLTMLLKRRIDGFLLVPSSSSTQAIRRIREQNVPVVVIDRTVNGEEVDVVRADSSEGSYQLTKHLLDLNHRRILMLSGPATVSTALERISGYRRAFAEANIPVDESLILHGDFTQAGGYTMGQAVLKMIPRPTALFAANNFIAIGAIHALQAHGVRVPEEMSIVTVDDISPSEIVKPFWTLVAQPAAEIGQRAAELLLSRIDNSAEMPYQEIVLPTELRIRKSSLPLATP